MFTKMVDGVLTDDDHHDVVRVRTSWADEKNKHAHVEQNNARCRTSASAGALSFGTETKRPSMQRIV